MPPNASVVHRDPVPVLYVRADGGPAGAPAAFARLEATLGGPKGRRFLGWFRDGEYRACVVRRDGEPAGPLAEDTVPGGAYARARHDGPWHDTDNVLAALFVAALEGYPQPAMSVRRVGVPLVPVTAAPAPALPTRGAAPMAPGQPAPR